MNAFIREFLIAARQGPRIYFAPLIGAFHGTREAIKDAVADAQQEIDRRKREDVAGRRDANS